MHEVPFFMSHFLILVACAAFAQQSTRLNHKSGQTFHNFCKNGVMTTGQSAIWTLWVLLGQPSSGVLDGIGRKNPPTTIPHFIGAVCLVISPDSLIPM